MKTTTISFHTIHHPTQAHWYLRNDMTPNIVSRENWFSRGERKVEGKYISSFLNSIQFHSRVQTRENTVYTPLSTIIEITLINKI